MYPLSSYTGRRASGASARHVSPSLETGRRLCSVIIGHGRAALNVHSAALNFPSNSMNRPPVIPAQHPARNLPVFRAALCEEYIRLRDEGRFTVTGAARALGRSASSFSGKGSMLHRYLRGGIAGLTRRGRGAVASDLAQQIESLGWFVPAAQFFYLSAHRRQGALVGAIRRAAALPSLPLGWRRETRARFLARLNLQAPPECPASLRERFTTREREGKPIVTPRIERVVKASPASTRRHCIEGFVEELARMNLSAIVTRLAGLESGGKFRLTLDLL